MKESKETSLKIKVGILFITGIILAITFAWFLGAFAGIGGGYPLNIRFNYVGGLQTGSAVRLGGVTVGKVDSITFLKKSEAEAGEEVHLNVRIRVKRKIKEHIRSDSKFLINMAGIIGDRYLEITPGSFEQARLESNGVVRGIDPPRIDQLLSQGYGVFGKIIDFLDENEPALTAMANGLSQFIKTLNSQLERLNKAEGADIAHLVENLTVITSNLRPLIANLNTKEGRETFRRLYRIIERGDKIDGKALKKFLQEEGVKTKIF